MAFKMSKNHLTHNIKKYIMMTYLKNLRQSCSSGICVMSPGELMELPSSDTCRSLRAASMSSSLLWLFVPFRSGCATLLCNCTCNYNNTNIHATLQLSYKIYHICLLWLLNKLNDIVMYWIDKQAVLPSDSTT